MMNQRNVETLETLAGERSRKPAAMRKAAVRIEDLAGLLKVPNDLQSGTVAAAPTQAEHNALVADVKALHLRLLAISEALTVRLR